MCRSPSHQDTYLQALRGCKRFGVAAGAATRPFGRANVRSSSHVVAQAAPDDAIRDVIATAGVK